MITSQPAKPHEVNARAELLKADIRELESIRPAFAGVDCVFHVAALPRVPLSIERPVETHMVNVVGTLNVLVAARDAGVRRVVYSGSSSAYGDQPRLPLREDMAPNPMNPYALQKLTGEQYTRLFHRLFSLQTLTLRYFNVFGPGMATEGAYVTVISVFLRARREGKPADDLRRRGAEQGLHSCPGRGARQRAGAGLPGRRRPRHQHRQWPQHHDKPGCRIDRRADGQYSARAPATPAILWPIMAKPLRILGWRPEVVFEDGLAELVGLNGL